MYGRTFETAETLPERPAGHRAVLRAVAVGVRRRSPATLGSQVEVNGLRRTVVGIMPPHFDVADQHVEVWAPLVLDPANRRNRGSHFLYLIGRLADGATLQSAKAELDTLLAGWPSTIARAASASNGPHTPDTEEPSPAARSAADADRRQRADRGVRPAGRGRVRAADRLREPRQPAARARRVAAQGVRRPHRARRRTLAAAAAVHGRRLSAVVRRRGARPRRRGRRRARADRRLSREPAAIGGRRARRSACSRSRSSSASRPARCSASRRCCISRRMRRRSR